MSRVGKRVHAEESKMPVEKVKVIAKGLMASGYVRKASASE